MFPYLGIVWAHARLLPPCLSQQNGSIVQNVDSEGQALAVHPSTKWVDYTEC